MSCGVRHFWNVMLCLAMPGGIPGTLPMSISILYSYRPSFILPLKASNGFAAIAAVEQATTAAASGGAVLILGRPAVVEGGGYPIPARRATRIGPAPQPRP